MMKLYYSPTSPFVRKVTVCLYELGMEHMVEKIVLRPLPTEPNAELSRTNPLSKIPALVLDDGQILYDSPVICEYLNVRAGGRLVPSGDARWEVLRLQALADGILDAAILAFYERSFRPTELHWEPWIAGQTTKVLQGLDALEREADRFDRYVNLGQISVGVALGWLEFRNAAGEIRMGREKLFAWYDEFRKRFAMQQTEPIATP